MPTHPSDEALTEQFYAWEKRGRGWSMFDYPVTLEPPFRPFWGHYLALARPSADEARRRTFFGAIIETLRGEGLREARWSRLKSGSRSTSKCRASVRRNC